MTIYWKSFFILIGNCGSSLSQKVALL